jgi:hypothetical protein
MINLYSSDNSILINKTSDCAYDLQALTATGQPLSLVKIDSNTVTLFGTGISTSPLKATVRLSSQTGNALIANSDGLFVATPVIPAADYQTLAYNTGNGNLAISNGNTVNIPFQQLAFDCTTKILQITGASPVDLSCLSQSFVETSLTAIDSTTIDFATSGTSNHTITADVKLDSSQPNAIISNANGLYVAPPDIFSETPITVNPTSSVALSASGTSNHTLEADVNISAAVGNVLSINLDGLYVPTPDVANTYTFDNGLTEDTGLVELGGTLIQNTTITTGNNFLNVDTGSGAGGFRMNSTSAVDSYMFLQNGTDNRVNILATVLRKPLAQGVSTFSATTSSTNILTNTSSISHNSTTTAYTALYGELGIDTTSNTVTFGTGIGKAYSGVTGVFTVYSSGTITGGIPSGGTFYSNLGGSTNVQNLASLRTYGIIQTPNTTIYSGTVTNYYGLYLEPLDASGTVGIITNKFGIFQAGTNDTNRFFGNVQNAGGTTQFTSDIRVKENFGSFTRGLEEVKKIVPRTFNYNYKKNTLVTGVIAQEIEEIIPEAVSRGNFSTPEGQEFDDFRFIDQNVLFYTLVNAIKDLNAKVELLEKKLNG